MLVLCLDASLALSSAALVRVEAAGATVLAEAEQPGGQGQAAAIALLAERVLREAGATPGGVSGVLGAVAAPVGPGGFTGIRAALSLAHGMAAGAAIPLVAVTTAEALAAPLLGDRPVAVLIDSRRGHRFVQVFDGSAAHPHALGPAVAADAGSVASLLPARAVTVGDVPEAAVRALPRARHLAAIAASRLAGALPPLAAQPLYLDAPAARPAAGLRPAPA